MDATNIHGLGFLHNKIKEARFLTYPKSYIAENLVIYLIFSFIYNTNQLFNNLVDVNKFGLMFSINLIKLFYGLKYLKYTKKMYYQVEWCKKIHIGDANKFGLMFSI